ncbi:MAG: anti-sigma factor family protein, partial [Planctomycetota bacterium]
MDCSSIETYLIDLAKDEIDDAGLKETVSAHMNDCAECRAKYEQYCQVKGSLKSALPAQLESADFAKEIIRKAKAKKSSRRFRLSNGGTLSDEPFLTRIRNKPYFAVSEPYFAVSVVLHAAALIMLVFVAVKYDTFRGSKPRIMVELDSSKQILGLRSRAVKHSISVSADNSVNLAKAVIANYAYVAEDYDTGSLWVYFIGGKGNM